MKENKVIMISSIVLIIICMPILVSCERETKLYEIFLEILTGTVVSLATASAIYFSLKKNEKNKTIDRINEVLNEYKEILATVEHIYDPRKLKEELEEKEIYEEYSDNYNDLIKNNYEQINKNINKIMTMKNINNIELKKSLEKLKKLDKKTKCTTSKIDKTIESINKIINLTEMYKSLMRNDNILYFSIQDIIYQDKTIKYIEKKGLEISLKVFNNKLEKEIEEEIAEL